MGQATSIQWTDATWNPVRGCSRVSEGCRNCYAERVAARFSGVRNPREGAVMEFGPFHGFVDIVNGHPAWTGKVELIEKHLTDPLKWKKPRKIFVNSMSDLFHEALPDEAIDRVYAVMALCPQHTFQVLTKRPERMVNYFTKEIPLSERAELVAAQAAHAGKIVWDARGSDRHAYFGCGKIGDVSNRKAWPGWPLPNVWLGVSCEDQKTADERIPLLLQTPAAVRFVSYEPALGPVDFDRYSIHGGGEWRHCIDWLIVGGESGPGARPFDIEWARTALMQFQGTGNAVFIKQLGARPRDPEQSVPDWTLELDRKGGNWEVWPEDLRVREFPREMQAAI